MVGILVALSIGSTSADALFDAALAAERRANSATVSIAVDSKVGSKSFGTRYELAYVRPAEMRLVASEPGKIANERTFFISGRKLIVYDSGTNELLRQDIVPKGSLGARVVGSIGRVDEAVQSALEPKVVETLFSRFRRIKAWRFQSRGGLTVVELRSPKGTTRFAFDRRSHLLREFAISTKGGFLRWKLAYGPPPARLSYTPPSFARLVQTLSGRVEEPKYADSQAQKVALSCVRALDRLRSAEFEIDSEGRTSHVWISGAEVRERREGLDWAFDGSRLWIVESSKGQAWAGRSSGRRIAPVLNALGFPPESFVQQLVQGRNPMRLALVPGATVRDIGKVRLAGAMCDILEISATNLRISVCVRQGDRLPAQLRTENVDNAGRVLASSERTVRYFHINRRIPSGVFRSRIPAGVQPAKLPKTR